MMNDPVARLMNLRQLSGSGDADRQAKKDKTQDPNGSSGPQTCFIQPLGLVCGAQAKRAVEEKQALWLAGGPLAFMTATVSYGDQPSEVRTVRELSSLKDRNIKSRLGQLTANRPPIGGLSLGRTRIVGLLDLTVSMARDTKLAVARGQMIAREGADAVAISMGDAPHSDGEDGELKRVIPVVEGLIAKGIRTAVFSRHAGVMREAAAAGVRFLADTGDLADDEVLHVVSEVTQPLVIRPKATKIEAKKTDANKTSDGGIKDAEARGALAVLEGLEETIEICQGAGIARNRLIVDPGLGATAAGNADIALLSDLASLHGLGCPILIGAERSRLVASLTGEPDPRRQDAGEVVVVDQLLAQGAQILVTSNVSQSWRLAMARRALDTGKIGGAS